MWRSLSRSWEILNTLYDNESARDRHKYQRQSAEGLKRRVRLLIIQICHWFHGFLNRQKQNYQLFISGNSLSLIIIIFSFSDACLWWGMAAHIKGSGRILKYLHAVLLSSPANGACWQSALVTAGWQSAVQSALNTHFLRKSLVNCSSSTIGHYPDIDSLFVQDSEKSIWKPSSAVGWDGKRWFLALCVIHSVSCIQRGLSSLVSLLLAFKECVSIYAHVRMCVFTTLFKQPDDSSGHTCFSYNASRNRHVQSPGTGMHSEQVLLWGNDC